MCFGEKKVTKQMEYVHSSQTELGGSITDRVDDVKYTSFHNECVTGSKILNKDDIYQPHREGQGAPHASCERLSVIDETKSS